MIQEVITLLAVCWIKFIFKKYCKMIAIYLSTQQAPDADPKAIQQINFTGNLNRQNAEGQNIKDWYNNVFHC